VTGSFGNPGFYIPAPGAVALMGLGGLMMGRRRR
jgi:xanthosine utilization system XapX-like protein